MVTVEERIAFLEGRVGEHAQMLTGVRDAVVDLEQRMGRRFEAIDRRFEIVNQRFDTLDAKISRHFLWLVGLHVTTLAAMVTALAGVVSALFGR